MDRRPQRPRAAPPLNKPVGELSPEEELRLAFGKAIGFTIAAIVLLVGGGILVILVAAAFFGFLYGR
jgi:hypothetical protein